MSDAQVVKGKHGGVRPNAGPKPKPVVLIEGREPLEFLLDVMQGLIDPSPAQLKAATAAVAYKHVKRVDGGKKDELLAQARKVAKGRFATSEPPKLVSSR